MAVISRVLWRSSSPTLLLTQACLAQVTQEHAQARVESPQRRRLPNLSGQSVPVLHHSQNKEVSPYIQVRPPIQHFSLYCLFSPATFLYNPFQLTGTAVSPLELKLLLLHGMKDLIKIVLLV